METIKNIAATLGLILTFASVITLCSNTIKNAIGNMFKKYGSNQSVDEVKYQLRSIIDTVGELKDSVAMIDAKLNGHIEEQELNVILGCRQRILSFANQLYSNEEPSKEYTENVLEDIDKYEGYCDEHKDFPNSKAVASIALIRKYYDKLINTVD